MEGVRGVQRLADWSAAQPQLAEARYEALTHGAEGRRLYFLIRRDLGFSAAEWDAMPWHHQRMYWAELQAEWQRHENPVKPQTEDDQFLADIGVTLQQAPGYL